MKKKKFYISHFILCIFLICVGIAAGYLAYILLSPLFVDVKAISIIALILLIPTLIVICVLPIYSGISYLISILKGEDEEMYPVKPDTSEELLKERESNVK